MKNNHKKSPKAFVLLQALGAFNAIPLSKIILHFSMLHPLVFF